MRKIGCIIVDDEPLALNLIEEYVKKTPFLELQAKSNSAVDALNKIREGHIELAFLDIQMPNLSGMELSKLIDDCAIVFTTAFDQYAVDGYKVGALDYLLKPFSYSEFLAAADKALKWFELKDAAANSGGGGAMDAQRSIVVNSGYRQQVIRLDTIDYVESSKDYIKIHTDDGEVIQTLMSLKSIEEILPKNIFFKAHRSFIVNLYKVKVIERNRIVFGKEYIPVTDKDALMQALGEKK
ncbi:MAG: LytTR family DNA-binding domain-containing protein [Bacteroidales bacterium]|nr:LytTR family DNA-binding domain-containing protein [Bacteroidales bacterium]MDD3201393.1 LytTR family DNA-binding domain-containing protein [Bacteroidales bacterium]